MKAVVSMRLHGLVFAAGQGVPLAGVSYDGQLSDGELKMTVQIEIVERNLRGGLS